MPIPQFGANGNLPVGVHNATWQEVEESLGFNSRRIELLDGLKRACQELKSAGCVRIYIGGSFATNKEYPGDFDVCWKDDEVNYELLVLQNFPNTPAAQKAKYGGELFIANDPADSLSNQIFLDFFQESREGDLKGIVAVDL